MIWLNWHSFAVAAMTAAVIAFIMYMIGGMILGAAETGPEYCHMLDTQWDRMADPGMHELAFVSDARNHFCELNSTTKTLEFNRSKYLESFAHMEN